MWQRPCVKAPSSTGSWDFVQLTELAWQTLWPGEPHCFRAEGLSDAARSRTCIFLQIVRENTIGYHVSHCSRGPACYFLMNASN